MYYIFYCSDIRTFNLDMKQIIEFTILQNRQKDLALRYYGLSNGTTFLLITSA